MGYRITYTQFARKQMLVSKRSTLLKRIVVPVILISFLIAVCWVGWSSHTIRYWLLPGDPQITEQALGEFVLDLKKGRALSDALTSFCCEIMSNA